MAKFAKRVVELRDGKILAAQSTTPYQ
jgi:hypothetical protein